MKKIIVAVLILAGIMSFATNTRKAVTINNKSSIDTVPPMPDTSWKHTNSNSMDTAHYKKGY